MISQETTRESVNASVIIPTYGRPRELGEALDSLLTQTVLPDEVIVVTGLDDQETKRAVRQRLREFLSMGVQLGYIFNERSPSLTSNRNLGIRSSRGQVIFFFDDDTIPDSDYLRKVLDFYVQHPRAKAVQGVLLVWGKPMGYVPSVFRNVVYRVFLIQHYRPNMWKILASGEDATPYPITTSNLLCMRLAGCMSVKREVFEKLSFDEEYKSWGFFEDADFSYRLYKACPNGLYLIPSTFIKHNVSEKGIWRIGQARVYMTTIYRLYFCFKNMRQDLYTTFAIPWNMFGRIICIIAGILMDRKPRSEWWSVIYLMGSYLFALRHLKELRAGRLGFFNDTIS